MTQQGRNDENQAEYDPKTEALHSAIVDVDPKDGAPVTASSPKQAPSGSSTTVHSKWTEPEPWFYKFLHGEAENYRIFAKVVFFVSGAIWLLWVLFMALSLQNQSDVNQPAVITTFLIATIIQALLTFLVWRGCMLIAAVIHLYLDHARNARRSRLLLQRQMAP